MIRSLSPPRSRPRKKTTTNEIWTTLTLTNGLPGENIQTLSRDPSGALWIGTSSGLSRFDGRTFTNFYGLLAHDSGPAGLHGAMMGNATVVNALRPTAPQFNAPHFTTLQSPIPGNVLRLDGNGSY